MKKLIKDNIYYCKYDSKDSIFQYNGTTSNIKYLCMIDNKYSTGGWDFYTYPEKDTIREASSDERLLLLACIKSNKFIHLKTKAKPIEITTYKLY